MCESCRIVHEEEVICDCRCSQLAAMAEEAQDEAKETRRELEETEERYAHKLRALEKKIAQLTEKDIRNAAVCFLCVLLHKEYVVYAHITTPLVPSPDPSGTLRPTGMRWRVR